MKYTINHDEEIDSRKDLLEVRDKINELNKLYRKEGFRICIDIDTYQIENMDEKDEDKRTIGHFFFYPTHKMVEYYGNGELKHIGYTVKFVRKKSFLKDYSTKSFDLTLETLSNDQWLKKEIFNKYEYNAKKLNLKQLTDITLMICEDNVKVTTTVVGWVPGDESIHYVPFSDFRSDNITMKANLEKKFNTNHSQNIIEVDAFLIMQELLGITLKQITIPLVSFAIISSLLSFRRVRSDEDYRFSLNLYGQNGGNKEALSNLFCKLYNRTAHIFVVDSILHVNNSTTPEIVNKVKRNRDTVLICKLEKNSKFEMYRKLIEDGIAQCGLLLISDEAIQHDSVVGFNLYGKELDESIIKYHQQHPNAYTKWFEFFINHLQENLDDKNWGLDVEGNIDKLYHDCEKMIVDSSAEFDPNKLRNYSWLLVGYMLFLNHGLHIKVLNQARYTASINEAVIFFRENCRLDFKIDGSKLSLSQVENDAILFLFAIDQILVGKELLIFPDKSKKPEYGLINDSKTQLYLVNKSLMNEVKEYLKEDRQYEFKSKNIAIYKQLFALNIIEERGENVTGWGWQHRNDTKIINYNIANMKKHLLNNGYELAFLRDK